MRVTDIPEITNLTTPEKILFVEDLWDSIAKEESEISVPKSHREELDRRFKRYEAAPDNLLSFEELQARIEKRN